MTDYELIVTIVNAGFSQSVMDAARSAGARGGTIVRGRGSANPEAEEFFNNTMQAIYKESGIAQEGQGIAFSLPVERTTPIKK